MIISHKLINEICVFIDSTLYDGTLSRSNDVSGTSQGSPRKHSSVSRKRMRFDSKNSLSETPEISAMKKARITSTPLRDLSPKKPTVTPKTKSKKK